MANPARKLAENVPGDFFVDDTCIDCDACRQIAPATFRDHGDQSSVYQQPKTEEQTYKAMQALVTCPTGSIGSTLKHDAKAAIDSFPMNIAENVYFCGFTSESSFGAWSYLIVRPDSEGGNVMIDSPRFAGQLVKKIERLGGIRQILLSHRDDVADHEAFARRFSAQRFMHQRDNAARYGVEHVIEGDEIVSIDKDLLLIPTPGHTRGHVVFLYKNRFLFTGDHLSWSPVRNTLTAFRSVAWYSWKEQTRSMERLLEIDFEWVLPGHGRIHHEEARVMHTHLENCIAWMHATP
jgi:glyoxylase-like metal-dependent hydrolase (beta-lactamase superfamily II)/ferredoxin